ncbi:MAG: Hint domain-containing protein [Chloroflexi bacterium]|nr:Hint domain-containing protein [Chloroflexota bacterium]
MPTAVAPDPLVQLKYRLFDRFGRLWYCDPDYYPVARADEADLAEQRFAEIQADAPTFHAIRMHLGYANTPTYTRNQKLAIYRDWKMLRALALEPRGATYAFDARFTRDQSTGVLAQGTIDSAGAITVTSESAAGQPNCPICLARGTLIATPAGRIPVEALRAGMAVWTADRDGRRVAAAVIAVGQTVAPADHAVVHLMLADGRELRASPSHPLADGRLLGALTAGDQVDGAVVLSAEREPYGGGSTFDLLPSGPTATYWADGVPLQSTLDQVAGPGFRSRLFLPEPGESPAPAPGLPRTATAADRSWSSPQP